MFVNSFDSDSVAVIDTATRAVLATIPVGDGPVDLVVSPGAPCPADFNGDGAVNTLDVLNFLNAWVAGC